MNVITWTRWGRIACCLIGGGLILAISLGVIFTARAGQALSQGNYSLATRRARQAQLIAAPILFLGQKWPVIQDWQAGLNLIQLTTPLGKIARQASLSLTTPDQPFLTPDSLTSINSAFKNLTQLHQSTSWRLTNQLSDLGEQLDFFWPTITASHQLINWLALGDHRLLFLLQNNHELRASGGFIGSLVTWRINEGYLTPPEFYDVYDWAGQITNFPNQTPPAVKKYLTAGQPGSLPDANWAADFATTGDQITQLLTANQLYHPDLIMAVNLNLIEEILAELGPVYLPDYQATITADNFAQIARQNRLDFFAGDKDKKHFLQLFFNQLKFKLSQVTAKQSRQILTILAQGQTSHDLLAYSSDPDLEKIIINHQLSRELTAPTAGQLLYLIESNVGINKANELTDRTVQLTMTPNQLTVNLDFINRHSPLSTQNLTILAQNSALAQADHLAYINYQRLIISPGWKLADLTCQPRATTLEEDGFITSANGQSWQQLGFLLTVAEQAQTHCQLTMTTDQPLTATTPWLILKQPGLENVTYEVDFFGQHFTQPLTKDWLITLR